MSMTSYRKVELRLSLLFFCWFLTPSESIRTFWKLFSLWCSNDVYPELRGLGCGEGGWQSEGIQTQMHSWLGDWEGYCLPPSRCSSKLSCGERESTAAEPALQETRFILIVRRWLWARLSLQEASRWRKNMCISYSKGGLGKKRLTPGMQGFKISQEISLTVKPCWKSVESQGRLWWTRCWEEGRRIQHDVLAPEAELHHRWDSTSVCVCNVYRWGSVVWHTKLCGNTEK